MRYFLFTLLITLPLFAAAEDDNIVILLSWDGMRHDFPDRADFPTLKYIEENGIRAGRLTPVYPSNTFPGHVSLATGVTPDVHGIIDNVFMDKEKGRYAYSSDGSWFLSEPLWVTAERQGVKAATYFWVGSETDWQGQGASYRMAPFDGMRPEEAKVDKMIEWLGLPEAERPRLIMSYWKGADTNAHLRGPDHSSVVDDITEQDIQLKRLMDAIEAKNLWPKTTLLIVSDHGMAQVTESVEFQTALEEANLDVTVTGGSAGQHIYVNNPDHKQAALDILVELPHLTVLQGDEIPKGMAAPNRTGDIVVLTEPPYTLSRADSFLTKAVVLISPLMGWGSGAHGYDPELPDMGGVFFAIGNGVTPGKKINDIHQLEIAPTVAGLLNIEKPPMAQHNAVSLR